MGVSVLNVEGLLTTAVASRSIMIAGAEHVPQGLPVWLMLLHQACFLERCWICLEKKTVSGCDFWVACPSGET
jgi:hypothetical protein